MPFIPETEPLKTSLLTCLVITLASLGAMSGADAADLKVRFVYEVDAPAREKINTDKDAAFCGKHELFNEELIVGEDGGIKNVVLSIYTGRGGTDLDDLGDIKEAGNKHTLANDKCRFEPHVLVLQKGDSLEITNPDAVGHNANLGFFENKQQNLNIPSKQSVTIELPKSEPGATPVDCNIHPWMKAYLLVLDHPFGAISDDNGELTIEGLPDGEELVFRVFHEKGSIKSVTDKATGEEKKLKRARFEITLKPGMNDLGTWVVPKFKD